LLIKRLARTAPVRVGADETEIVRINATPLTHAARQIGRRRGGRRNIGVTIAAL
jgi:hypothetical protein